MELAATRPELIRSLVATSSPTQPIAAPLRRQIRALVPIMQALGPVAPVRQAILGGLLTDASRRRPEIVSVVVDALTEADRTSVVDTVRSFILNRVDIAHLLPDIQAPTLFVSGDDRGDWTGEQAAAAAALVPGARSTVIAGSRTLIPLEQPAALADAVRTFWSTLA